MHAWKKLLDVWKSTRNITFSLRGSPPIYTTRSIPKLLRLSCCFSSSKQHCIVCPSSHENQSFINTHTNWRWIWRSETGTPSFGVCLSGAAVPILRRPRDCGQPGGLVWNPTRCCGGNRHSCNQSHDCVFGKQPGWMATARFGYLEQEPINQNQIRALFQTNLSVLDFVCLGPWHNK